MREREGWDRRLIHQLSKTKLPTWRQIRHLPEVLSSNDSLRLQAGAVLFALGLAILGVRGYYAFTEIVPAVGGTLVEGVVGAPRSLNPILAPSNDVDNDLTRLTFSRLFATDAEGEVAPELAASYEVSSDLKTYDIRLRDALWHDGERLTVDDALFTIGLIQDPAWKSPLAPAFKDVTAERVDDRTLRLVLKEPFAPFLSRLTFGILPKHVWKDVAPQDAMQAEANLKPIGSGPFKFSELKRDKRGYVQSVTLVRNPDHFAGAPFLEHVVFKFYPDYRAAIEALHKRQVESLSFVPHDLRKDVRAVAGVVPVPLEVPQYYAVFFNQRQNPLLKEKDLRRALIMATDKGRIVFDVLDGEGHPLSGPALPGFSATGTGIAFSLTEAGNLLDKLSWKLDPDDGIRKRTSTAGSGRNAVETVEPLRLALTVVDQPESLEVAGILKAGWRAIGVDLEIVAVPASEIHRTVIKPRAYDALLYGQLLGPDNDPYPFWHSSQAQDPGLNLAMFADDAADAAIVAAQRAVDPQARREHLERFMAAVREQLPADFLYSPTYTYPLPSSIKGFAGKRISVPADRFASVTSWYMEEKRAWK